MENGALLEGGAVFFQNSFTRGAELRTSKHLPKGSYFGSLFFLSACTYGLCVSIQHGKIKDFVAKEIYNTGHGRCLNAQAFSFIIEMADSFMFLCSQFSSSERSIKTSKVRQSCLCRKTPVFRNVHVLHSKKVTQFLSDL